MIWKKKLSRINTSSYSKNKLLMKQKWTERIPKYFYEYKQMFKL